MISKLDYITEYTSLGPHSLAESPLALTSTSFISLILSISLAPNKRLSVSALLLKLDTANVTLWF